MAGGGRIQGRITLFSGGKGRRISCRRQSKKWDCRELTANLLPTSNEGGGGKGFRGGLHCFQGGREGGSVVADRVKSGTGEN